MRIGFILSLQPVLFPPTSVPLQLFRQPDKQTGSTSSAYPPVRTRQAPRTLFDFPIHAALQKIFSNSRLCIPKRFQATRNKVPRRATPCTAMHVCTDAQNDFQRLIVKICDALSTVWAEDVPTAGVCSGDVQRVVSTMRGAGSYEALRLGVLAARRGGARLQGV